NITAYSGKDKEEDVVYSSHNLGNVCIAKNYTKPKYTDQHEQFKKNAENIRTLWVAANSAFKNDLTIYAQILNINFPDKLKATSYALFVKICYAAAKMSSNPLESLSLNDFDGIGGTTISGLMENQILPYLKGCDHLISPIT
ncbi:MAG TPA: hypothetical protein PLH63_01815, partial [Candidatus Cloacimonadota bacterium]|nr:hypothetical protein [Candidatus Cloacimonadota bacterium]